MPNTDTYRLTPYQQKYIAWELERNCSTSDDAKFTSVLAEAKVDLNPHQVDAALFAFRSPLSMGAILADEVGLGKTIEAGLVIAQHWAEKKRHILVITPATLRKQWNMELEDKFYLPSIILESRNFNKILADTYSNPFENNGCIVICSYQFAKKQIAHIERVKWDLVVIDEAHKLRNVYKTGNKTATAIKDGLKPFKKLLLTATPLQNNVKELYGLISIIDDGYFGSLKTFNDRYGKVGLRSNEAYKELRGRISPIIHRTLRSDVQEYVKYTERHAMVQEYYPSSDEIALSELVTEYLQRDECYGLPRSQRMLISLVLHKLLSSSTFAIAGTLKTIIDRLSQMLEDNVSKEHNPLIEDIQDDFDDFDDFREEWEDEEATDDLHDNSRILSPEDIEAIKSELVDLNAIYELALGIAANTKGECLMKALEIAFADKRNSGLPEKALIFTESKRTQEYLHQLLESNGYKGKIVLFNGANSDSVSKEIYATWLNRHKGTSSITGSMTADRRQAIVDYFRDTAQIMIATEAASEGINLQFCSLLVNFDLPWNPQRVEQRIGRCHRYGQKNDVVVVNFINKANRADQRVYELLSEKYNLFQGVFGASDEVLGSTMDGLDFEHRVLDIYQSCRSSEEIDAAFDALQNELKDQIDATLSDTRHKLIANFDEDVVNKLRLRKETDQIRLTEFNKLLWMLTMSLLRDNIEIIDNNQYKFLLKQSPDGNTSDFPKGPYQMGRDIEDAYTYRVGHPLARMVIAAAKKQDTSQLVRIAVDYSNSGSKISILESAIGAFGIMKISILHYAAPQDDEDRIVAVAVDADGNAMDDDFVPKIMTLPAKIIESSGNLPESLIHKAFESKCQLVSASIESRNRLYINEEIIKIEQWAEDKTSAVEQELKDIKRQIKEKERNGRAVEDPAAKLAIQREIQALQRSQRLKRQEIFTVEDEILARRDAMIQSLDAALKSTISEEQLFTIEWIIE